MQRQAEQAIAHADRADRQGARKARTRPAGQPGRDEPDDRRRLRARRRAGLSREQLQPRDPGAPPGRIRLQADHLRRGARARLMPRGRCSSDLDTPIETAPKTGCRTAEHERDEYTLRGALKVSSNRAAAQLLQQVGVTTAIYYAQRLGIDSQLPMVPSLALGTGEVTLLELTAAYSAFANQGSVASPRLVAARRGPVGHHRLVCRGAPHPGDQPDDRLSDVQHAVGRRHQRHRDRRPFGGLQAAGRRQDRHDRRLCRRLVHRLYAAPVDRRVVRPRSAGADHARWIRRHGGRAGVGPVHDRRDAEARSPTGIGCRRMSRRSGSAA